MLVRSFRSIVVGAGLLGLAGPAIAASHCAKDSEAAALRTRMMQTELMVAALACNQRTEYNDFVMQYRPVLKTNGSALQSYFRRSYGQKSTDQLNTFTTRLANEASRRSINDINTFCAKAATTFAELKALPTVKFANFVAERPTADSHGMTVCGTPASLTTHAKATTHVKATTGGVTYSDKKTTGTTKAASTVKKPAGPTVKSAAATTKAPATKTAAAATKPAATATKTAATATKPAATATKTAAKPAATTTKTAATATKPATATKAVATSTAAAAKATPVKSAETAKD